MNNILTITNTIVQQGLLPLYFHKEETVSVDVLRAIYKAGIRAVEYTNRGEEALRNFTKMLAVRNEEMPDLLLGIGTIKNIETAKEYLNIGADFLVSPGFVKEVAEHAVSNDIFYAPGCMTATEIITAENAGVKFIKLFPGNVLKPEFMSSIKDVFQNLLFMPTGGVDATRESITAWFDAGVCTVGMGSKLISKKLMDEKNYITIETDTRNVLALISKIKRNA
jgi:2-dehydro-3-deoxyphosphogluconate aldolase / (4S)-4-hydroxy-2-oxoglutarate aldolase